MGEYLLRRFDTPWLSAVGWLLMGMLLERGFEQGQPLVLAGAAGVVVLAWLVAYSRKKLDEQLRAEERT